MSEQPGVAFRAATLAVLGVAMLLLCRVAVHAKGVPDLVWFLKLVVVQIVIYLAVVWLSLRTSDSQTFLVLGLGFAALFRLSIIFSPPYLSDDIYRYVWDGRVQAAGINPYRYIPAAPELAQLRDDAIYPKINRREIAHTIYPPVAQVVFLLTTRISESVVWMKLTMLIFEMVAIWAIAGLLNLLGRPRQLLLLYAWHPLVIWEFAGSGHCDAIAIGFIAVAFLAWQRRSDLGAGFLLASATLAKLFPLVLLPAMLKRGRWRIVPIFAVTITVGYLAYLNVGPRAVLGDLDVYTREMGTITGQQFYAL